MVFNPVGSETGAAGVVARQPDESFPLNPMRRMGNLAVMKCFLGVLISLFVLVSLGPVRADLINGQNYVSLIDWARANGLKPAWLTTGDKLVASDRDTRLVFEVDSAQAEINGVEVRLSFPVAKVKGSPLVAQFDLDKSVRPLLYPSRYVKPQKITTICLDPGHGGKDTGNLVNWHKEKTYTLYLAYNLRDQLKQAGFQVILTRTKDEFVELPDRPAAANQRGADLFVSLHFNATGSGKADVNGAETYCITPVGASSSNAQGEGRGSGATTANRYENQSLLLAYQVQKSLGRNLGAADRGVRRARFAVLRDAAMPSILIEGGYMTHPVEGEKIYSATYRRQMAAAIARGIIAYQKLTAPPIAPRNYTSKKTAGSGNN